MNRTLNPIDWNDIINHLEGMATSETSRETLRSLEPLTSPEAALASFEEIAETGKLLSIGRRPSMESLDLFSTWFERLKREAVLKPLELRDTRHFCLEVVDLNDALNQVPSDWLSSQQAKLMNARAPLGAIDQIMTASGDIRSDASEELHVLFREKQDKERELQNHLDRLTKTGGTMDRVLQDRFVTSRQGRWVVPVRNGMQKDLKGVVHDKSNSRNTVFVEPQEVVLLNNHISRLEDEIETEIERLLTQLSKYLHGLVTDFENSQKVLMELDVRLAQAQFSQQLDCKPCSFTEGRIHLEGARHPQLALQGDQVIPNDVFLDLKKRILLLSGPNAGGKTVLLKSVGLAAHMARCGLPICASENSVLPFFDRIFVAVGDDQSVERNLSTFAAHLKALTEATEFKGSGGLLLIDEICSSTDPEEGAALARSFIESFEKAGVFGIITSHLGPLKEGWDPSSGVINGRLEFDEKAGRPTYRLYLGLPGQSLALKTAKAIGVPREILDRALEFLNPETRDRHKKMDRLETIQQEVEDLRLQLTVEMHEAKRSKDNYQKLVEQFKKEKTRWLEKALEKAEKEIENILDKARTNNENLKSINELRAQLPQIIKTAEKPGISSPEDFARSFPPGSMVYIPALQQEGLVQGTPDGKGRVTVLSQSMRLQLPWQDITFPKRAQTPSRTPTSAQPNPSGARATATDDRVLDLRGQRVEEALRDIEQQLDVAIRNGEDRVKVIHGHGTDALKKAIRTYISRSPYVRKWKAGDAATGGDGVTWVELVD